MRNIDRLPQGSINRSGVAGRWDDRWRLNRRNGHRSWSNKRRDGNTNRKSPGNDGNNIELIKYGDNELKGRLPSLFRKICINKNGKRVREGRWYRSIKKVTNQYVKITKK